MPNEHFCLKWNNYQTNIVAALGNLKLDEDFVDVTLSCEGKSIKAHKVILSACSDYFRDVFRANPCSHPVVILRDASFVDVEGLVRYVYRGEVDVQPERLQSLLRTAEMLKIKGLAEQTLAHNHNVEYTTSAIKKEEPPPSVLSPLSNIMSPTHQPQPHFPLSLSPNSVPLMANSVARPVPKVPPIKVPVPPSSHLKRSNFTNLAQYLSGSPTPSAAHSPPHDVLEEAKRRKTARCLHAEHKAVAFGSMQKQHYSGSTSSLTPSPASPPRSHSTEGAEGEDTDRESACSSESVDFAPRGGISLQMSEYKDTAMAIAPPLKDESDEDAPLVIEEDRRGTEADDDEDKDGASERSLDLSTRGSSKAGSATDNSAYANSQPSPYALALDQNGNSSLAHNSSIIGRVGGVGGLSPSSCWHGKCPHCLQEYANISSLKYHVRLVHSDAKNSICCYLCPAKLVSKVALREHLLAEHQVKYQ